MKYFNLEIVENVCLGANIHNQILIHYSILTITSYFRVRRWWRTFTRWSTTRSRSIESNTRRANNWLIFNNFIPIFYLFLRKSSQIQVLFVSFKASFLFNFLIIVPFFPRILFYSIHKTLLSVIFTSEINAFHILKIRVYLGSNCLLFRRSWIRSCR